jgi:hypothetical protein
MCFGRSKPAPPPPPPPPVELPKAVPTQASPTVVAARKAEKQALALNQGRKSTILTGPRGLLTQADTQKKTLLGA